MKLFFNAYIVSLLATAVLLSLTSCNNQRSALENDQNVARDTVENIFSGDRSKGISEAEIERIGKVGASAAPFLANALKTSPDDEVGQVILAFRAIPAEATKRELVAMLRDPEPKARLRVLYASSFLVDPNELAEALLPLLSDPADAVREVAYGMQVHASYPGYMDAYREGLGSGNEHIRFYAAKQLAIATDPSGFQVLFILVGSSFDDINRGSIDTIVEYGGAFGERRLKEIRAGVDQETRKLIDDRLEAKALGR